MITLPNNVQTCRILAQKLFPYWQQLLWSLEPVEMPGLGTTATDGKLRFYFDREEVEKWPINYMLLTLMHEVIHITNRHHERGNIDDNVAADMAVNCWLEELIPIANEKLKELGLTIRLEAPDDWIHPTNHCFPRSLALEDYRALLQQKNAKQPKPSPLSATASGRGIGDDGQGRKKGTQPHPGPTKGNENGDKPDVGRGSCGSCAHREPAPWELTENDDGPSGLSEPELDVRIRQVAEAVREYGQKAIGKLPAFMSRWAQRELKPPTIPWTRELASAARAALHMASGATYRHWSRISRRSDEILFPGMRHPIPSIAMVVDVSGSMSEQNIQTAISEAQGVIKELSNTPVPVLAVDAAVGCVKKVCDMRRMPLVGGGGTDMAHGIEEAAKLKPKPSVIIVLTDGYTGWPQQAPDGTKVIAVLVCKGPQPPEWIRTIRVEEVQ